MYQGLYKGEPVALKIFLEAESMKKGSFEGIQADSSKIVDKMEKVCIHCDCVSYSWSLLSESPRVQEVNVMASLDHPHIVELKGFCRVPPCIMTELCRGGNLAQTLAICQHDQSKLSWAERLQIVC